MVSERGVFSTLEVARAGKTSITGAAREDVKCVCSHVYGDHHRFYLPKLNHTCTIPKVGSNNNFILCGSNLIWPWLQPFGTHGALWEIGGIVAHPVTESNHQSGLGPGTAACPSISFYWWLSGESLGIKKKRVIFSFFAAIQWSNWHQPLKANCRRGQKRWGTILKVVVLEGRAYHECYSC